MNKKCNPAKLLILKTVPGAIKSYSLFMSTIKPVYNNQILQKAISIIKINEKLENGWRE
jgi:hypothetical protein